MFARNLVRVATAARPVTFQAVRPMTGVHGKFKQNEDAAERDFINRAERELLHNLLKKIETSADPQGLVTKESLKSVLLKNKINPTEELVSDLIAWKRSAV